MPKRKTAYQIFLKSAYWKKVRQTVKSRDKYKCTKCGNKKTLQVHHKSYQHLGSEHKHLADLTTLCSSCHRKTHAQARRK